MFFHTACVALRVTELIKHTE